MGIILSIAWRNIWRNPRRSALSLLLLMFSTGLIVLIHSLIEFSHKQMLGNVIDLTASHLQIMKKDYYDSPSLERLIKNPTAIWEQLKKNKNVIAATFRLQIFGLLSTENGSGGVTLTGIDPQTEPAVSVIHQKLTQGQYLNNQNPKAALIGTDLAQNYNLKVGDEIVFLTQDLFNQTSAAKYTVGGIFATGSLDLDAYAVFLPLSAVRELTGVESAVTHVVIKFKNPQLAISQQTKIIKQLNNPFLELKNWRELLKSIVQFVEFENAAVRLILMIVVFIIFFGILNATLMTVLERTRELGILKAIGTTPLKLAQMVSLETAFLGVLGIFLGLIFGSLVATYFMAHPIRIDFMAEELKKYNMDPVISASLSWPIYWNTFVTMLISSVLAGLYPALKAARLIPAQAIRSSQ